MISPDVPAGPQTYPGCTTTTCWFVVTPDRDRDRRSATNFAALRSPAWAFIITLCIIPATAASFDRVEHRRAQPRHLVADHRGGEQGPLELAHRRGPRPEQLAGRRDLGRVGRPRVGREGQALAVATFRLELRHRSPPAPFFRPRVAQVPDHGSSDAHVCVGPERPLRRVGRVVGVGRPARGHVALGLEVFEARPPVLIRPPAAACRAAGRTASPAGRARGPDAAPGRSRPRPVRRPTAAAARRSAGDWLTPGRPSRALTFATDPRASAALNSPAISAAICPSFIPAACRRRTLW